jgi:transposase
VRCGDGVKFAGQLEALRVDIEQSNEPRMGARRDGGAVVRVERRRRWSDDEKLAILKETTQPGAIMAVVARRSGIGTGQLYTWRRQLLQSAMAGFVPVELASSAPQTKSTEIGRIEIGRQGGFTVSIDRLVDRAALKLVLEVVGEIDR